MRFMVLVKATPQSEAERGPADTGQGPEADEQLLRDMGNYNEELVKAGVMLAGPFTETKELVAGYWIWQVKSREEAIEWLKRAPFDGGAEVELRQLYEMEDFAADHAAFTPELQEQEARMRSQLDQR